VQHVRISPSNRNLGTIMLDSLAGPVQHENKFGQPYDRDPKTTYPGPP